jgi:hypothetical protein
VNNQLAVPPWLYSNNNMATATIGRTLLAIMALGCFAFSQEQFLVSSVGECSSSCVVSFINFHALLDVLLVTKVGLRRWAGFQFLEGKWFLNYFVEIGERQARVFK